MRRSSIASSSPSSSTVTSADRVSGGSVIENFLVARSPGPIDTRPRAIGLPPTRTVTARSTARSGPKFATSADTRTPRGPTSASFSADADTTARFGAASSPIGEITCSSGPPPAGHAGSPGVNPFAASNENR
jgi:hypothetical protein